jgi:hypothetical protein
LIKLIIALCLLCPTICLADPQAIVKTAQAEIGNGEKKEYSNEQIVNAIYKAEGSNKAQYLYGIRSVSYDNPAEARRICFNTVRNNRKRYADYGYKQYKTYLEFLQSRYCPINAKNDPKGLNKNWLKNVKYFLDNPK